SVVAVLASLLLLYPKSGSGFIEVLDPQCGATRSGHSPQTLGPWTALLHENGRIVCAGTLIHTSTYLTKAFKDGSVRFMTCLSEFILTAAHCIKEGESLFVTLGEYNRDQAEDCLGNLCMDPVETYDVNMALRHKFYNSEKIQNDIGMLRLDRRVTYKREFLLSCLNNKQHQPPSSPTAHIQPICVFVDSKLKPLVDNLTWFDATGWGHTRPGVTARVLQDLKLNRRPFKDCELMFGKQMFSSQICSGNDDSNLCHGDSGGPQGREMAYGDSTVYVQLGIASFTSPGCRNVSILTDVLSHGDWIKRVVRRFGVPEAAAPAR
ncbi:hypothetical protein KR054_001461, partial [Drosophila jambulina]